MTRRGAALFVALLVVLLGGLVVVVATMVAAAQIRAGTAWSEQQRAATLGASAAAQAQSRAALEFPVLLHGQSVALDDTVMLTRLGDSVALLSVVARSRLGTEVVSTVARTVADSGGGIRLRLPPRSRVKYHPVP